MGHPLEPFGMRMDVCAFLPELWTPLLISHTRTHTHILSLSARPAAYVGRHIFDHCILGLLALKTRILVTHQLQVRVCVCVCVCARARARERERERERERREREREDVVFLFPASHSPPPPPSQYLPAADVIIVMRDGQITDMGAYDDLLDRGVDLYSLVKHADREAAELAKEDKGADEQLRTFERKEKASVVKGWEAGEGMKY